MPVALNILCLLFRSHFFSYISLANLCIVPRKPLVWGRYPIPTIYILALDNIVMVSFLYHNSNISSLKAGKALRGGA
jgi:hypothetical protein